MSEPTTVEVMAAAAFVKNAITEARRRLCTEDQGPAWDVVQARVEHALAELKQAYPTETHDWFPLADGIRCCAQCERIEGPDGFVHQHSVRPCSFDRRPPCDAMQFEGDCRGYADHLINEHGIEAARAYRASIDAGSWVALDEMHKIALWTGR